jgi:hypothetical protein
MSNSYEIEQLLLQRAAERYRDNNVSEVLSDYFELQGDVGEIPLMQGLSKRNKRAEATNAAEVRVARRDGFVGIGQASPPNSGSPITNRGVTFRQTEGASPTFEYFFPHIMGGYDGGLEVGFEGKWNKRKFDDFCETLNVAKQACQQKGNPARYFVIENNVCVMKEKGASNQITYKYVFETGGMKFYVHSNPQGEIQPIRLRYNAEGLIGRDLFLKHNEVLETLSKIGFTVTGEKISRVDMQVMLERDIEDFMQPLLQGQYVCTAQKYSTYGRTAAGCPDTFTLGKQLQICIYDKRRELLDNVTKYPHKFSLMIKFCLGDDWLQKETPLTRIEFRILRDVLRDFGIHSLSDLLQCESGLSRYCCNKWFRMISERKSKTHTERQKSSELWQEVQKLFETYFPGVEGHGSDVSRGQRAKILQCSVDSLEKQALGCLKTAAALRLGSEGALNGTEEYVLQKITECVEQIALGAYERALEHDIRNGNVDKFDPQASVKLPDRETLKKYYE